MTLQQTSLEAYAEGKSESIFVRRREEVYWFFLKHPNSSDQECANQLRTHPSLISARRNELVKLNRVVQSGEKVDEFTNRKVLLWSSV